VRSGTSIRSDSLAWVKENSSLFINWGEYGMDRIPDKCPLLYKANNTPKIYKINAELFQDRKLEFVLKNKTESTWLDFLSCAIGTMARTFLNLTYEKASASGSCVWPTR
jgi:hypothetical protein